MSDSEETTRRTSVGAGGSSGYAGGNGSAGISSVVSMVPQTAYPLCRLNETNYQAWSLKMRMLLQRDGLWRFIENPPRLLLGEEKMLDQRAQAHIILSLEDSLLVYVRNLETAQECWNALKDVFIRDSIASTIALTRRLYRARLQVGASMKDHIRTMQETFKDLDDRGVVIPEYQKALTLLSSLDESWDVFALTLESLDPQTLTLPYLSGRLLQEEQKRHESSDLWGKTIPKTYKQVKPVGEDVAQVNAVKNKRCWKCQADSHLARSCPKKKGNVRYIPDGKYQVSMVYPKPGTEGTWILDTGTNTHITHESQLLTGLRPCSGQFVCLPNGSQETVIGTGNVYLPALDIELQGVLCVPTLKQNLLSMKGLMKAGYSVLFKQGVCEISGPQKVVKIQQENGIYKLHAREQAFNTQVCSVDAPEHEGCLHTWHGRLGHLGLEHIRKTIELSRGVTLKDCKKCLKCEACELSKPYRAPMSKKSDRQTTRIMELLHVGLAGPFQRPTMGNAKFLFVIIDDFSRFGFCYLLQQKSQAVEKLKQFIAFAERRFGQSVVGVQSDQGGEFQSTEMEAWLNNKGITRRMSFPHTSEHGGVAECRIGVLKAIRDCMLQEAGLSQAYAGEALLAACHVLNRTFDSTIQDIPYTLLYDRRPDLSYLRIWGVKAYVHIPYQQRKAGQLKAQKLVFVGYSPGSKAWRFLSPDHKSIVISRSATFIEHVQQDGARSSREQRPELILPSLPFHESTDRRSLGDSVGGVKEEAEEGTERDLPESLILQSPDTVIKGETAQSPLLKTTGDASPQAPAYSPRKFLRSTRGQPPERLIMGNHVVSAPVHSVLDKSPHRERLAREEAIQQKLLATNSLITTECLGMVQCPC